MNVNMKKTPVSLLQEMMVKKGISPNYELIHDGGGTHQNSFTYQVSCDGFIASGSGRCKKDAKHEAATLMLETIAKHNALPQLPATPCESPVRTPLPLTLPVCPKSPANAPFRNAIGELQYLCTTNNLEDPEYKEIGDVGPPHARIFTVQCCLSTFTEEGTATTKKHAKHEAARKMVERVMDLVSDINKFTMNDENIKKEQIASTIAMAKYPQLSVNYNEIIRSKVNWGLKIKNYHKKFKENFDEDGQKSLLTKLEHLLTLIECCHDLDKENLTELRQEFESTLESIDMQFSYHIYNSCRNATYIHGIQLTSAPDINEIGIGNTEVEAEVCALHNVIESMKYFLQ